MRFRIRSHMPTDLSEGHVPLDTSKLHPEHAESLHLCKRCAHNALLGQTALSRQHRPPNKLLIAQISSRAHLKERSSTDNQQTIKTCIDAPAPSFTAFLQTHEAKQFRDECCIQMLGAHDGTRGNDLEPERN